MDDRERDLADATAELTETLDALREELRKPPEGPLGLPRPPKPSELLRFTEQYTIPTVIALLETSIRALELLAAALRVADGRPLDGVGRPGRAEGGSLDAVGRAGRDRLAETSRETLRRLDDALAELQSAAAGEPSNPELRELLGEARDLRAEVDTRLSEAVSEPESERTVAEKPEQPNDEAEPSPGSVGIDVDEELASIKRTVDDSPSGEDRGDTAEDGDGADS